MSLHGRLVQEVPSEEGLQADLILVEPNGDEHPVRCLVRPDGRIEVGNQGSEFEYICTRYGAAVVFTTAGRLVDPNLGQG